MIEETREAKPVTSPTIRLLRTFLRTVMGGLAGAVVGLCVGLGVGILGGMALVNVVTGDSMVGAEFGLAVLCVLFLSWWATVWMIAMGAAGAMGGVVAVRQRPDKKATPAKAELGASTTPPQQNSQRGRDALLINGLALLFFVAAYLAGWFGPMYLTAEAIAVMLWIAAYTFFCWSLVLAARALGRGEPTRRTVIVCCALGLEIAAPFLLVWFFGF